MRSLRTWRLLVLLAGLGALSGVIAGCGGTAGTATATGVPASEYASRQYGYFFKFPTRCVLAKPTPKAADPGLAEQVIVADPSGMVVGGTALDVFSVTVYRLSPAAGPSDLKAHTAEFQRMAAGLAGRPKGLRMVAEPAVSSLGGEPALAMEYFSGRGEARVGTLAYFVPKGDYAYWVRLQSSSKTKGSSTLVITLATFKFE